MAKAGAEHFMISSTLDAPWQSALSLWPGGRGKKTFLSGSKPRLTVATVQTTHGFDW